MIPSDDVLGAVSIFFLVWLSSAGALAYFLMGLVGASGGLAEVPAAQARRHIDSFVVCPGFLLAVPAGFFALKSWEEVAWAAGLIAAYWVWKLGRWWWNK